MAGISDIARKAGIDAKGVREVVAAIKEIVQEGDRVQIQGFGTFRMKTRAARTARNPNTGETVQVPEKKVLTFKPS